VSTSSKLLSSLHLNTSSKLLSSLHTSSNLHFSFHTCSVTVLTNILVQSYSHHCILHVKVTLRPTVSRPVCPGISHRLGQATHFSVSPRILPSDSYVLLVWDALSDERTGLQFTSTNATGPCQRCHSRAHIPWKLRPYLTASFETGFSFCRLPRLAGLWWRYPNPPPHRFHCLLVQS
jgi:hypothetical protein